MTPFQFATAARIQFGAGSLRSLAEEIRTLGGRGLLVIGRSSDRAEPARDILGQCRVEWTEASIPNEPTVDQASALARRAATERCDWVVSFGGGAVIDGGKAVAALAANPGDPLDHLEVIGRGLPLRHPPLPFVAIPTTAGTGAEVTRNAVLGSPEHRVKVSLRSPSMLPRLAIVDPVLTLPKPRDLTAATGMDALTQLLEPWVGCRHNPMTDALCQAGIPMASSSLARAFDHGADLAARTSMSYASLLGGMALANSGLGAVHGFAGPLGGMFDIPHGALCAALLAPVWKANCEALRRRDPDGEGLRRHVAAARMLTGIPTATVVDGEAWIRDLTRHLGIRGLGSLGVPADRLDEAVAKAQASSSMKGNPVVLEPGELRAILEAAS